MTSDVMPIPTRLRPDLLWSPYAIDRPDLWIAHDPVHREFYFFSDVEKAIALSLDGIQSVSAIVQKCRRIDATVTANFVRNLVRRLDQASLLLHRNWRHADPAKVSVAGRWLSNTNALIAWRVPLMNPTRAINRLLPIGRVLYSTWALFAFQLMGVGCLLMLAQRWTELIADLHVLQLGMRGDRLLLAAVLFLAIKALHELGHALACRIAGADCREIGVFFFFGVPCMYCDVSDVWRVPNRWKRIFVSAAGIITELMIAILACVIWLLSTTQLVQSIALQIMFFCSIVTLLINANPLLRYDGYYILSDAMGIPNLADQSREAWYGLWRSWLFGFERSDSVFRRTALALFHLASSSYRWFLLAALIWSVNQWLLQLRLGGFGTILTTIVMTAILANLWRGLQSCFSVRELREPLRWFRVCFWAIAFALLVWAGGTWRIPHHLFARGVVQYAEHLTLYARHSAILSEVISDGSIAQAGRNIVVTESPELELDRIRSHGELNVAKVRLRQAASRSVDDPLAALQLAELEKTVSAIEERVEKLEQERGQLQLQSQVEGMFFELLLEQSVADISGRRFGQHIKLATLSKDRAYVERGQTLGEIVLSNRWSVSTFINELEIDQCKLGAKVWVRLDQMTSVTIPGKVESISAESIQRTPKALIGDTLFASTLGDQPSNAKPEQTTYSVIIDLDVQDRTLVRNGLASVQIETVSKTIFQGWLEGLQRTWALTQRAN